MFGKWEFPFTYQCKSQADKAFAIRRLAQAIPLSELSPGGRTGALDSETEEELLKSHHRQGEEIVIPPIEVIRHHYNHSCSAKMV